MANRIPVWKPATWHRSVVRWILNNAVSLLLSFGSLVCYFALPKVFNLFGYTPGVGVYVTIMGVVIAAMALRKEPNRREKALWMVLVMVFATLEIRDINTSTTQQVQTTSQILWDLRATQKGLDAAAEDLKQSTKDLKAVMDVAKKNLSLSNTEVNLSLENLNQVTGGDSYPVLTPEMTNSALDGLVRAMGKYPMHELLVQVFDFTESRSHVFGQTPQEKNEAEAVSRGEISGWRMSIPYLTAFSFPYISPHVVQPLPRPIPFSSAGERHLYTVQFYAWNGSWNETIYLRKDRWKNWRIAYQVFSDQRGNLPQKLLEQWAEPNFPLLPDGKPDFSLH